MNTLLSGERSEQNWHLNLSQSNLNLLQSSQRSFVHKSNEGQKVSYYEYLLSPEWRALRRRVFVRAKGTCELCGVSGIEEVHHLTYRRFRRERLSDLLGLCSECHEKIHNIKNNHLIPLVFGGD